MKFYTFEEMVPSVFGMRATPANAGPLTGMLHQMIEERAMGWQPLFTLLAEVAWAADRRPFYRVHNSLVKPFFRSKLRMPWSALPHVAGISVELQEGNGSGIRSLLGTYVPAAGLPATSPLAPVLAMADARNYTGYLMLTIDTGERGTHGPDHTNFTAPIKDGELVVDTLEQYGHVNKFHEKFMELGMAEAPRPEVIRDGLSLFTMVLAMAVTNSPMLEAVVLAADREKYAKTGDARYVEKARKRGVVGYNVGARMEVVPHYRVDHFAGRWKGKGRTRWELVPVRGGVVNRKRISDIPQGEHDA